LHSGCDLQVCAAGPLYEPAVKELCVKLCSEVRASEPALECASTFERVSLRRLVPCGKRVPRFYGFFPLLCRAAAAEHQHGVLCSSQLQLLAAVNARHVSLVGHVQFLRARIRLLQ
jgi:hypothetical protein